MPAFSVPNSCFFSFAVVLCFAALGLAGDPYVFYDLTVSYLTASPLGVKQKVLSFFNLSYQILNWTCVSSKRDGSVLFVSACSVIIGSRNRIGVGVGLLLTL